MEQEKTPRLDAQREHFGLQAHFLSPVFDLLQDVRGLSQHLFSTLGPNYSLNLTNMKLETGGGSLGDVHLSLTWPALGEARIFLDRVEVASNYLQFLRFQERDLVSDVVSSVMEYMPDIRFRAYSITRQAHGILVGESRSNFLSRFASYVPGEMGPLLGSGVVFYFGEQAERLATSVTLDFSRVVDGGIFVQSITLYDASRIEAADLQESSSAQFSSLLSRVGLAG
jgi:hypothetical protein